MTHINYYGATEFRLFRLEDDLNSEPIQDNRRHKQERIVILQNSSQIISDVNCLCRLCGQLHTIYNLALG